MPLLQFLAYYQVVEFYFPVYSQKEAIKQARNVMKHPAFSIDDENDVGRLLNAIKVGKAGGFGDERAQLRATIVSCVDAQDLRTFLNSDDRFSKFYSTQSQWKEVSTEKIPLSTVDADLRNAVPIGFTTFGAKSCTPRRTEAQASLSCYYRSPKKLTFLPLTLNLVAM